MRTMRAARVVTAVLARCLPLSACGQSSTGGSREDKGRKGPRSVSRCPPSRPSAGSPTAGTWSRKRVSPVASITLGTIGVNLRRA